MENDQTAEGEAHAEGEELTHGTEAAHDEGPIPLLQPAYFDNLIFWAVLSLVAIYLIVSRIAVPRIGGVFAQREGTIGSDLAAAETFRAQAREAQAAYDKALAEARAEANRIAQQTRDSIQAELDAALAQADARIEARAAEGARAVAAIQAEAQSSVGLVARDVAREILQVLGAQADEAAVDRAVAQRTGG